MLTLPQTTINGVPVYRQSDQGDGGADFLATFNIDTSENQGMLRVGKRFVLNTGSDDVAELTGVPTAFIKCGSAVFTFAGASNTGYAFKNDGTMVGTFAKDSSSNAPTTVDSTTTDAVFSNNSMYVPVQDASSTGFVAIHKKTGNGSWSKITTTATFDSTMANMTCSYGGRTYVSYNQSQIMSLDSADTIAYAGSTYGLTINVGGDFQNVITKLLAADDRIFILSVNTTGGKGHIREWDGQQTAVSYDHILESSGALSGVMYQGTPYVMDCNGVLLQWNGGTFVEVARLYRRNNMPLYNPVSLKNNRFIHPNGMSVVNRKIHILINNQNYDNAGTIEETIPSGVYEYDPMYPMKGLIHKGSVAFNKASDTINQYGQIRVPMVGALKEMGIQSTASDANGSVFMGAGYYSDVSTSKYGVFYDDRNDTLQKYGYFISDKMAAQNPKGAISLDNMWKSFTAVYSYLLNASDRIVVKYRVSDVAPTEATITWTSTTTFTTTTDVTAYSGYEAEILLGKGAGKSSTITSVVNNSGTYTVTLQETFTGATSGTSKARFQYWKERGQVADQNSTYKSFLVNVPAIWIQFKVCFLFTGKNDVERMAISNAMNQLIQ